MPSGIKEKRENVKRVTKTVKEIADYMASNQRDQNRARRATLVDTRRAAMNPVPDWDEFDIEPY